MTDQAGKLGVAPLPDVMGGIDPGGEATAVLEAGPIPHPAKLPLRAWAWALFQGGRDPQVMLITIYIFMPYFATVMVRNPVLGQSLVADIGFRAGLIAAVTGPVLGACIDQFGPRKPGLLFCVALMAPLLWALWWAKADGSGISVAGVVAIGTALNVIFAYTEVFHNSLLTRAATPVQAPHASGLALSSGNFVSVLTLAFILVAFALPGKVHWSFIPAHPLFGLDAAKYEPDRIVAPISAVLLVIGCIPLFLFTPDARSTGVGIIQGFRRGLAGLVRTVRSLKTRRNVGIYLGSRMLYYDGMTTLLYFGGVYARGVMRWGVLEMLAYGILLSVFAVIGGLLAGVLDSRIGPKNSLRIEILAALFCLTAQLGMGRDKILFFWRYNPAAHAPLWNGPMFRTLPEVLYLCIGFGTAVFVCAQYASSRTLLTRLTPASETASFFGLYALSGTVTLWLGSILVRIATGVFKTQQAGFAPIAALLLLGFLGMLFVRGGGRKIEPV